ncbi:MAG: hypothetical protein IJ529_04905 [Alphaproteobacteria bacterium]|nr:hypothetical protein [Alphaproteobacteria bacterium]
MSFVDYRQDLETLYKKAFVGMDFTRFDEVVPLFIKDKQYIAGVIRRLDKNFDDSGYLEPHTIMHCSTLACEVGEGGVLTSKGVFIEVNSQAQTYINIANHQRFTTRDLASVKGGETGIEYYEFTRSTLPLRVYDNSKNLLYYAAPQKDWNFNRPCNVLNRGNVLSLISNKNGTIYNLLATYIRPNDIDKKYSRYDDLMVENLHTPQARLTRQNLIKDAKALDKYAVARRSYLKR